MTEYLIYGGSLAAAVVLVIVAIRRHLKEQARLEALARSVLLNIRLNGGLKSGVVQADKIASGSVTPVRRK
jgi:hypothetical protein